MPGVAAWSWGLLAWAFLLSTYLGQAAVQGSLGAVICPDKVVTALLYGDPAETLRLIVGGATVDCTAYSRGLLHLALNYKKAGAALYLARSYSRQSWQFFVRNASQATVLHTAADLGYAALVEELVRNKGLDPLLAEAGGNTSLHLAARWPAAAAKILEFAPDLAPLQLAVNGAGDQAIHVALKSGSAKSAEQMLERGFLRVSGAHATRVAMATDAAGRQPVHLTGDAALLRLLARRGAPLSALDGAGARPLHTVAAIPGAASSGALALLLAASDAAGGGGPDVRDGAGRTPLHYAAAGGVVENIDWLLARGADSGATDNAGMLPLSLGLKSGQGHIVDAFGRGRSPPLKAVVSLGSVDTLRRMVLVQNVSVHTADPYTGRSAIFEACERGQNEMVGFLLSRGANANSVDRSGLSVLAATVLAQKPLTVQLLLNRSVDVGQVLRNGSTALHVAASRAALAEADLLLAAGASVDAADYYGQTPMHLVSSAALADRLLQYGAKPLRTVTGLTPLHSAALAGRSQVVETVLRWRHGGVDEAAANGDTPLHLAAASGSADTVMLLLRWCADSQARNGAGRLPHQLAFDAALARTVRDATLLADRCQCDCGPYNPGPLFRASEWRGGCTATVRCQLDGHAGTAEALRCAPQAVMQAGQGVTSAWSPLRPQLTCRASAVSAAARPVGGQAHVGGILLALVPALWRAAAASKEDL